jgi:DNA-binding beta-propeller fold protein YncE
VRVVRAGLLGLVVTSVAVSAVQAQGRTSLVVGEGLNEPFGVAFDDAGNTYVVEMAGNRVSVVAADGTRRVLAGTGEKGLSGDDGPAAAARLNGPHHLLMGPDGALYVADTWNHCVRRIDLSTGVITRVAGTGEKGYSGDGGPAREARFGGIYNIAFRRRSLYVCDLDNRRVRAVSLDTGVVTTVAGNGEKGVPADGADTMAAPLVDPRAIAFDSSGRLYIAERGGNALRVVEPWGAIRTVAGNGETGPPLPDGPALEARLNGPKHLFVERGDTVLVTDTESHTIRRYSPGDRSLRVVVGTGEKGSSGLGGPPRALQLNRPHGAEVHPKTGALYVSDSDNHRVVKTER